MVRRMTLARCALGLLLAIVVLFAATAFAEDVPDAAEQASRLALQGNPERALIDLRQLADQGDAKAQLYAGIMLAAGQGTHIDKEGAVEFWRQAAEQNLAEAQFRLGMAYAAGAGVPMDLVEGAKWLFVAGAQDGMAYQLISESLSDAEVTEARSRAAQWRIENQATRFRDAMQLNAISDGPRKSSLLAALSDEGMAAAQYELGRLHQQGVPDAVTPAPKDGSPAFLNWPEPQANDKEAVRYFHLAAEQGYTPAMVTLAAALEAGRGVEQDFAAAMALYQRAAEKGDLEGKWGLATMLLGGGDGADIDRARGLTLLSEVAAGGAKYFEAQAELAERLEGAGADLRLAYMWYAVAARGARFDTMPAYADRYDQARVRLETLMSDQEIDRAKAMAGECVSTGYEQCRSPEPSGLLDLFGF